MRSTTSQDKIRFGIYCNGFVMPHWKAVALQQLLEKEQTEVVVVLMGSAHPQKGSSPSFLWTLYDQLYLRKRSKAGKKVYLEEILQDIPVIHLESALSITSEVANAVEQFHLDVVLQLDHGAPYKGLASLAKSGCWFFSHDHPTAGFWPLYRSEKITTGALVQALPNNLPLRTLKTGVLKTQVLHPRNRDLLLMESASWPRLAAKEMLLTGYPPNDTATNKAGLPAHTFPGTLQIIRYIAQSVFRLAHKVWRSYFFTDYWNVGVANAPITEFLQRDKPEVHWFPRLPMTKFIADPFAMIHDDKLEIIYEVFPFNTGIGEIASLTYHKEGFVDNGAVITEPFHMSYPYLIRFGDDIYCIPETWQANQVRLYKAIDFPLRWTLDRVLIDGYAGIDNTPVFHNGYWWLFSTDKHNGAHYNLNLFYTKDFFDEWHPHPLNPVKTDIRSARPAGSIFEKDGELYRPAMDYSEKIEGRIIVNRITQLGPDKFMEVQHSIIDPYTDTYFSDKIHTLAACGPYTIIDGARELFIFNSWDAFRYKMSSKLGKRG